VEKAPPPKRARATHATSPAARDAAEALLLKGNAVDAVVAGVAAAAAVEPSVLLGPVQLLFGGGGAGIQAVSGRVLQGGKGQDRPRGFREGERIPEAARVGASALPAALAAAVATFGQVSLSQTFGPAIELAKGSPRKDVLSAIARVGARAMSEGKLGEELFHAANRVAGGVLSRTDLEDVEVEVERLGAVPVSEGRRLVTVPWGSGAVLPESDTDGLDGRRVRAVLAVDRNGLFAIAVFEESLDVLRIEELGLSAPLLATPVRRGETRVKPGTPIAAAFPGGLVERDGAFDLGLVVVSAVRGERAARELLHEACKGQLPGAPLEGRLLGVTQTGDVARSLEAAAPPPA